MWQILAASLSYLFVPHFWNWNAGASGKKYKWPRNVRKTKVLLIFKECRLENQRLYFLLSYITDKNQRESLIIASESIYKERHSSRVDQNISWDLSSDVTVLRRIYIPREYKNKRTNYCLCFHTWDNFTLSVDSKPKQEVKKK